MILCFPSHAACLFGLLCGYPSQISRWLFCSFLELLLLYRYCGNPEKERGEILISSHLRAWNTLLSSIGRRDVTFRFPYSVVSIVLKVKQFDRVKFFCICGNEESSLCHKNLFFNEYVALMRNISTIEHNDNN